MDDELDPDEETEYEYDKADRLIEATGDNDQTYVVDANGNLVNHYKWVFSPSPHDYDQENRLIEVKMQSSLYTYFYSYNGDGNRVLTKRKFGSTENLTSYVYDVNQPLPVVIQDTWHPFPSETRKYVWGLGLLCMVEDDEPFFYHQDNLGSVRAVTDEDADMDSSFEYEAFGGKVEVDSLSTQPFGFTGEVDDNSFGFVDYMYLRARHYNPFIGRFLSRDSYAGDITRPLSLNRYTYTENNPVNYVDPSGHAAIGICGGLSYGAMVYVSAGTCLVADTKLNVGWTSSATGGGVTGVLGGADIGLMLAEGYISDMSGESVQGGGSASALGRISAEFDTGNSSTGERLSSVTLNLGIGLAVTPIGPFEIHGGLAKSISGTYFNVYAVARNIYDRIVPYFIPKPVK